MKKAKRKVLKDEILGFQWCFQIGGTEESAYRWFSKRYNLPPAKLSGTNEGSFGHHESCEFTGLIWLNADCRASTLAHEAAHAVIHVCTVLDMDPREVDEFQASYIGYLVKHLNQLFYSKTS